MKKNKSGIKNKIKDRNACVAIIGLGYVGLPLACTFAERGFSVFGIDTDKKKIASLKRGTSYVSDLSSERLKGVLKSGKLILAANDIFLSKADAIIVCVPTPLNRLRDPDLSILLEAVGTIKSRLRRGQLIVLESTTYPGTTEEIILPILEEKGLKVGEDFFLCFSPERIDPGNSDFFTNNIPKVVGGVTKECSKTGALLYDEIIPDVVKVSSPRTAEMAKLLENTFRIVNIGLINELAVAAKSLDIDIWEAIDAAKTKPFGFMPFYPGPGVGGHCIGVDPLYLSWKARFHGTDLHFIELARRVNAEMPQYVVSQIVYALSQHQKKAVKDAKILILGVSYKKDISDTRESPAIEILEKLNSLGAKLNYHDPYVPELSNEKIHLKSKKLSAKNIKEHDIVVVVTNHSQIDYEEVLKRSRLIFDTRNVLKGMKSPKIVRL